ncbi:ThuA domain-containing protein [Pedobacter sp. PWIIR3]
MVNQFKKAFIFIALCCASLSGYTQAKIFVNQVGFDSSAPKSAVLQLDKALPPLTRFELINEATGKSVFSGPIGNGTTIDEWFKGKLFYKLNFSTFRKRGRYQIRFKAGNQVAVSNTFVLDQSGLARLTIPSIVHYYHQQRANTPQELAADVKISPKGSDKKVDMRGGWADASGDISKYFSHLAYANYMSPQQIPLVAWSLINTKEAIPGMLKDMGAADSIQNEALYGADYLMRSLTPEGYFYMIIFSHFNKDPAARDIVGLLANSVTTTDYQCAFREGGGMAIASLARISRWKKDGAFTSGQYLDGAKRAFAHLLVNNSKYTDDGKDNIIDDYCALMAATELWIATEEASYGDEARRRALSLVNRMSPAGYFFANDAGRPFWHGADAGMPVVALARYLDAENDPVKRTAVLGVIKKALDYNLSVTGKVNNPFNYARQSFLYKGKVKEGFFIPQENETGWWWQGENARLASLATAAIVGGRLVYPASGNWGVMPALARYASDQLSWVMGGNPYQMCFMYGFGKNNVPYMAALFGHGSQKGGISNGITGKDGNGDGTGIDFKTEAGGNEWRWTEQWLPHAAWFLQAVTAMAQPRFKVAAIAENGGHHVAYSTAAKRWLNQLAADSNFTVDYYENPKMLHKSVLANYRLVIQLDYPPYNWGQEAEQAFEDYIDHGRGSWLGFHHATLLGEFDGFPLWKWYCDFMGGIQFKNYIAKFASGDVVVEQKGHPVFKGLPGTFNIKKEEWYTYDKNPRLAKQIQVLASVNEQSYVPNGDIKMGDHPVVWTNKTKPAKNLYVFMGHGPELFDNPAYTTMVKNAIFWLVKPQ